MTTALKYEAPATGAAACSPEEWALRVELAACYRIFAYLGWIEMIFNHITMRLPGPDHHFLINPFGLHYSEVTASNLVKIDLEGNIIGHSEYSVNPAGFVIHSAIHAGAPDALCIVHTHTTAGMAVACSKRGLAANNFYGSAVIDKIAYHDFEGPAVNDDEKPRLVRDLGNKRALILRNHGLLCHGKTIPEAFDLHYRLQRACEVQLATSNIDEGIMIPESIRERSRNIILDAKKLKMDAPPPPSPQKLFDAMVRIVDRLDPSYKN